MTSLSLSQPSRRTDIAKNFKKSRHIVSLTIFLLGFLFGLQACLWWEYHTSTLNHYAALTVDGDTESRRRVLLMKSPTIAKLTTATLSSTLRNDAESSRGYVPGENKLFDQTGDRSADHAVLAISTGDDLDVEAMSTKDESSPFSIEHSFIKVRNEEDNDSIDMYSEYGFSPHFTQRTGGDASNDDAMRESHEHANDDMSHSNQDGRQTDEIESRNMASLHSSDPYLAKEGSDTAPYLREGAIATGNVEALDPTKHYETSSRLYAGRPPSNKTHLIFHVGPPKTGTTSIQIDLTSMQEFLALDNYFYAGRYYNPFFSTSGGLILNRSESVLHSTARVMLKPRFCQQTPKTLCMEEFKRHLQQYRGRNVVLSDESWGPQAWPSWQEYEAIQQSVGDEWDVTVVVGYRPYFHWLRSDMFQRYRLDMHRPWKDAWPGVGEGLAVRSLFPDYYKYDNVFKNGHRFTNFVLRNAVGRVHVRVMNLVDGDESLRTKFTCKMMPDAPNTCAASLRMDELAGGDHKWNVNNENDVLHVHYDILATRAAALGLIDTAQHSREVVRWALLNFTQNHVGVTPSDLDLTCPTKEKLDDFLKLALELEIECLGETWAAQVRANTAAAFQVDVDNGVFCTVDADYILHMESWRAFLKQFSKKDETLRSISRSQSHG
jgi:hypothetical protein